jgi:hypothetical protein
VNVRVIDLESSCFVRMLYIVMLFYIIASLNRPSDSGFHQFV